MSLSVMAVQLHEQGRRIPLGPSKAAGFERWRTDVWASQAVISVVQAVRRPRPSRLILPSLASQDILVEGEELDQLEREVDAVSARAREVVRAIQLSGPSMIAALLGGVLVGNIDGGVGMMKPRPPSGSDILEHFRARLSNIKEAVQLARTVSRGGVSIS